MTVEVHAFATLKKLLPDGEAQVEVEPGTTVHDLARSLNLPLDEIRIVMRNNRHVEMEAVVEDGDRVAFFPAVGGG